MREWTKANAFSTQFTFGFVLEFRMPYNDCRAAFTRWRTHSRFERNKNSFQMREQRTSFRLFYFSKFHIVSLPPPDTVSLHTILISCVVDTKNNYFYSHGLAMRISSSRRWPPIRQRHDGNAEYEREKRKRKYGSIATATDRRDTDTVVHTVHMAWVLQSKTQTGRSRI